MAENDKQYVVIVGAGFLVMPAYRIAREELGLGIIALDRDPEAEGMLYADVALEVSTKDVDQAVASVKKLAGKLQICGVFTCGADVEVTVAAIAEALGLPGVSLEVARNCNDKVRMHRVLDKCGFTAKARYAVVNSLEQAETAVSDIGLPCIIKPTDNCASRGVQRIDLANDVAAAYQLAASSNINPDAAVLVEELLDGSKHTVEMIAGEGEWHLLSIIDTHYISPRWPCETGLNTTLLNIEQQKALFEFSSNVARLMGVDYGAHKVDVNLDSRGKLSLIELTARLSGGFHCQYASPLAYGSHDIRAGLKLAIGQALDNEDIRHRYERGAAVRSLFPEPGRIISIEGLDEARRMPGVEEIFIWKQPGDMVGPYRNSADRFAYIITAGETTEQAIERAERSAACVLIRTEPRLKP